MKKIFKNKLLVMFIFLGMFFFGVSIGIISYANNVSNKIVDEVLRLHIVPNSNSKEDQEIKLVIKDQVLEYMKEICKDCKNKQEAIELLNKNINKIEKIVQQTLLENGFSYGEVAEIGKFNFPTKTYGDIALPQGEYDALRITLGSGSGQNWWCVMFPPLCFVDVSSGIVPEESKQILEDNMGEEEYNIIIVQDEKVNVKFKLIEFIEGIKSRK